jgi:hypothetical protein
MRLLLVVLVILVAKPELMRKLENLREARAQK